MRIRITFRNFSFLLVYCNKLDYLKYYEDCFADAMLCRSKNIPFNLSRISRRSGLF
jgi:hypothetical protein